MEENAAMLNELCQRAAKRHITLYSRFLNLAQQREGEIAARRAAPGRNTACTAARRIANGACWL